MTVNALLCRRILCGFGLLCVLSLVVFDSRQHFDGELIQLKKQHYSAQKNWNIFYGQENVYHSGGLKHEQEFKQLAQLLKQDSAMLTDLTTSYYVAANLPLYVKNVHLHHGGYKSPEWHAFIRERHACYLDAPGNVEKFKRLMADEETRAKAQELPPVRYIAVNRTHYNVNFKRGCLSQRRRGMLSILDQIGAPVFEGETITVYRLSTTAAQSDQHGSQQNIEIED